MLRLPLVPSFVTFAVLAGRAFAGDVMFDVPVDVAVGDMPIQTVSFDLDGDALPDLATANQSSQDVTLLANGGGTFTVVGTVPFAGAARRIAASDLNGDDVDDLVVTFLQETFHVAVALADGAGGFLPPAYYGGFGAADGVKLHDIDGDLDLDVIVSDRPTKEIRVYRNRGFGDLDDPEVYVVSGQPSYPGDLALVDLNGDEVMDLVSAAPLTNEPASFLLGAPNGTFAAPVFIATNPGGSVSVDAGDLDGDGDIDLAIIDFFGFESLWIFFNDGNAGFTGPVKYDPGVSSSLDTRIRLADLDGNDTLDAVVMAFNSGRVDYLLNDGHGAFAEPVEVLTGGASAWLLLEDLDGDDDPDLVLTNHGADLLTTLANVTVTGVAAGPGNASGVGFAVVGPNPMREATTFAYSVDRVSPVQVVVYDVAGRRVRTLVDGVSRLGVQRIGWDARDDAGRRVGSGVYFARFVGEGVRATERLIAVR